MTLKRKWKLKRNWTWKRKQILEIQGKKNNAYLINL